MLLPYVTATFIVTPLPEKKIACKNSLHSKTVWQLLGVIFAVFSGPDLIANLFDRLKIMDPSFITCDDIGRLLFVISWRHLKQIFGHFNQLPPLLVSQQMWHPSSRNILDFQMLPLPSNQCLCLLLDGKTTVRVLFYFLLVFT